MVGTSEAAAQGLGVTGPPGLSVNEVSSARWPHSVEPGVCVGGGMGLRLLLTLCPLWRNPFNVEARTS